MAKEIVVLGASWAGVPAAKKVLSLLPTAHVTLVNPSSSTFWNLATPRAMLPDQIPIDDLFFDIPSAFSQHSDSRFTLLLGRASAIDPSAKTVTIDATDKGSSTLNFDALIIATGASPLDHSLPIKQISTKDVVVESLTAMQTAIGSASHIVVGGGGPTSIETAGELGYTYGKKKKVVLVSGTERLLPAVREDLGRDAKKELEKLNVQIKLNTRVEGVDKQGGKTKLTLGKNGETLETDLFIPLFGERANSDFMPPVTLAANGDVLVDKFLRVKGLEGKHIYAAGDVSDCQAKEVKYADVQGLAAASNVALEVEGKELEPYKRDDKPVVGVSVGRGRGIGLIGNFRLFSLMIWFFKSRHMMVPLGRTKMDLAI
ncbi:MAG: hypothetical protein M1814_005834 [Vezdaea aestivalis]|nr:MAG: hypothetical protein M1814_005834 [Vezdaea aestivalis]